MWPFKPLEPFVTLLLQPEVDLDRLMQYLFARIVPGLQRFGLSTFGRVLSISGHAQIIWQSATYQQNTMMPA
jgi:hypothetical protein